MKFCRLFFLWVALLLLGSSVAFAAEPTLAFDLIPAPYLSVTDIEEPEWRNTPYDREGGKFLTNIRLALQGNAVAMANLAITTEIYGDLTEKRYPRIPHAMHQPEFWTEWAERFTSKGWVMLRKGYAEKDSWRESWFTHAADAGNAEGMYLVSKRMSVPSEKRKELFWKAVELGNGHALVDLGWAYFYGGVSIADMVINKDRIRANMYLKKAAATGEIEGLISEAFLYADGDDSYPKDPATAYVYYLIAKSFVVTASDRMYICEYSKKFERISASLTPEIMALAEKTADDWIAAYNALITQILEEARMHRAPILEEFRKELAPVIEWLAEQDAAAAEKSR